MTPGGARWILYGFAGVLTLNAAYGADPKRPARTYKWIDEQGQVHYSDALPPAYSAQKRTILNKQGMAIETIEGVKDPAEPALETGGGRNAAAQHRARRIAYDRMLLSTFADEPELRKVHDVRLQNLDQAIRPVERRVQALVTHIARLRATPPTPEQRRDLAVSAGQLRLNQDFLAARRAERQTMGAQFERDLARWRVLNAEQQRAQSRETPE